MDVSRMTFPDSSFDFVFSYSVFHHLPNPAQAFREVARVLRAGGVAYISFQLFTSATGCLDPRYFPSVSPTGRSVAPSAVAVLVGRPTERRTQPTPARRVARHHRFDSARRRGHIERSGTRRPRRRPCRAPRAGRTRRLQRRGVACERDRRPLEEAGVDHRSPRRCIRHVRSLRYGSGRRPPVKPALALFFLSCLSLIAGQAVQATVDKARPPLAGVEAPGKALRTAAVGRWTGSSETTFSAVSGLVQDVARASRFVNASGSDRGSCSRSAPCKTLRSCLPGCISG